MSGDYGFTLRSPSRVVKILQRRAAGDACQQTTQRVTHGPRLQSLPPGYAAEAPSK